MSGTGGRGTGWRCPQGLCEGSAQDTHNLGLKSQPPHCPPHAAFGSSLNLSLSFLFCDVGELPRVGFLQGRSGQHYAHKKALGDVSAFQKLPGSSLAAAPADAWWRCGRSAKPRALGFPRCARDAPCHLPVEGSRASSASPAPPRKAKTGFHPRPGSVTDVTVGSLGQPGLNWSPSPDPPAASSRGRGSVAPACLP